MRQGCGVGTVEAATAIFVSSYIMHYYYYIMLGTLPNKTKKTTLQFVKECSDYLPSHLVLKVVSRYYGFAMNKHALYSLISTKWVLFMVLRVYM